MIDPMFARLGGCVVFFSLLTTLLVAVAEPRDQRRDMAAAVEVHHRVTASLFARP